MKVMIVHLCGWLGLQEFCLLILIIILKVSIKFCHDHPSTCAFSSSLWRLWLLICEAHLVCNRATVRFANYISPFLSVLKKVKADISTDKGICISLDNFCGFLTIFSLLTDLLQLHSYSSLRRSRQTSQLIRGKTWHKIHLKILKESSTNQHYELQLLLSTISVLKKAKPNILND